MLYFENVQKVCFQKKKTLFQKNKVGSIIAAVHEILVEWLGKEKVVGIYMCVCVALGVLWHIAVEGSRHAMQVLSEVSIMCHLGFCGCTKYHLL